MCVLPCLVTNNYFSKKILLTLIASPNFHFYFTKIPHMFHFGSTWITLWIHSKCTFIPSKIHLKSNIDQVPSTLVPLTHHLQCVPPSIPYALQFLTTLCPPTFHQKLTRLPNLDHDISKISMLTQHMSIILNQYQLKGHTN